MLLVLCPVVDQGYDWPGSDSGGKPGSDRSKPLFWIRPNEIHAENSSLQCIDNIFKKVKIIEI